MRNSLTTTTIFSLLLAVPLACSDDGSGSGSGSAGSESETSASASDSDSDSASVTDSDETGSATDSTSVGDGDGDDTTNTPTDSAGDGDGDDTTDSAGDGDGDDTTDSAGDGDGDGDGTTDSAGDGDMSGDGDGDGDGDMSGDGDGDMSGDGDGDMGPPLPPTWLLSIDNPSHMLQRVDIFTGQAEDLCELQTNNSYPSLTFSRGNTLYASRSGSALDVIDPCTCEITPIGDYGGYTGVNGITADNGIDLRGIATTQDDTIAIDTESGMADLIGPLGSNFGTTGATWTDEFDGMWAINGNDDWLYQVDAGNGMASQHVALDYNFGTVGIEISAFNGVIYACSSAGDLLSVDPDTGEVEIIGDMGNGNACTNLAAPFEPVECIDEP